MTILNMIFARKPPPDDAQESRIPVHRLRSIAGSTSAERAAEMLTAPTALMQLSHEEARAVVAYMKPRRIEEGVTFIREGDTANTNFMLLDGAPRSASCTAMTPLRCAVLTREALNQLLQDDPQTAAKLMMAISMRIAERMRECQEKLKLYAQLTQAMNEEINELMPL